MLVSGFDPILPCNPTAGSTSSRPILCSALRGDVLLRLYGLVDPQPPDYTLKAPYSDSDMADRRGYSICHLFDPSGYVGQLIRRERRSLTREPMLSWRPSMISYLLMDTNPWSQRSQFAVLDARVHLGEVVFLEGRPICFSCGCLQDVRGLVVSQVAEDSPQHRQA